MQLTLQDAFALAARHESAGRRAHARAVYEQILAALPDHPGALLKVAEHEIGEGRAGGDLQHQEPAGHLDGLAAERAQVLAAASKVSGPKVGALKATMQNDPALSNLLGERFEVLRSQSRGPQKAMGPPTGKVTLDAKALASKGLTYRDAQAIARDANHV